MSFVLIFTRDILREVMHNILCKTWKKKKKPQWFPASKVIYSTESLVTFKLISYFMDFYKLLSSVEYVYRKQTT